MNKSARAIALETLIRILQDGSYSNISLNNSLNNSHLSQTDQNLATRLVYGTVQYKIFLDYQLKGLLKTKITEKYLYPLLLMSLYQLIFLDKIPDFPLINKTISCLAFPILFVNGKRNLSSCSYQGKRADC